MRRPHSSWSLGAWPVSGMVSVVTMQPNDDALLAEDKPFLPDWDCDGVVGDFG